MKKLQFRVLYREFLFRIVDLEILSAHALGDTHKLLGQFAALLTSISVLLTLAALVFAGTMMPPARSLLAILVTEHFLIANTMLVVGLFAVLSWDSTFLDRRDVLVLSPLPVRARTMFLAKVAAVATGLGLTIALLHGASAFLWPFAFATHAVPQSVPALTFDPTPTPVSAADLQSVLDRDLANSLTQGGLAPGTGAGLVVGVSKHGVRRVFAYGAAHADSLFEIGSLTKTFTGLALARMVEQGKAKVDEPVRNLLPEGTVSKPSGTEITLLDLATHYSGLPGVPNNFRPSNKSNPFADYTVGDLYEFLRHRGLMKTPDTLFQYSNLGFGLLGQALVERAGVAYANLIEKEVTGPLGLRDTVPAWDLDNAFAGAGAMRSTAADLLSYLEANLHPDLHPTLRVALMESLKPRADAPGNRQIALAWFYQPQTATYSHSDRTGGFRTFAFFNRRDDYAAVILLNCGSPLLNSLDLIDVHIEQRLAGKPAVSVDSVYVQAGNGFSGLVRWYAAYWFTMLAAGVFIYCAVLVLQGCAAQLLPRRYFLRISGPLQLLTFCLFVLVYFLQPVFSPDSFEIPETRSLLPWLPSYWFLGLIQQLNGSMHPALAPLAQRAWIGLAVTVFGTALAYSLSYMRTLRKIVEEPDIAPGSHTAGWLPSFGNRPQNAIAHFSVRTLLRSRQHRLILAFYLGIGFAFTIFLLKAPALKPQLGDAVTASPWGEADSPLLAASIVMMVLAVVGTRVVFALPLDLRANWIFRVTGGIGCAETLVASRRALLLLSMAPVWLATAVLCFWLWPWRQAAGHVALLGLIGMLLADICLRGFRKIPFTCSYLPGKSQVHMVFLCALALMWIVMLSVKWERQALQQPRRMATVLVLVGLVAALFRWFTSASAKSDEEGVQFEETPVPAVQELGL